MNRETRLIQLGKRVEQELGTQPISHPIAAGAALASVYAQERCTPQEAIDYMGVLATAANRLQETEDRDDLLCRVSASCGSTLRTLGDEYVRSFLDPARSGVRHGSLRKA